MQAYQLDTTADQTLIQIPDQERRVNLYKLNYQIVFTTSKQPTNYLLWL
jgi:hypothetical protein